MEVGEGANGKEKRMYLQESICFTVAVEYLLNQYHM